MDTIIDKFEKMGARCQVRELTTSGGTRPWREIRAGSGAAPVRIDVRRNRGREFFDLAHRPDVDLEVLSLDVRDRHLVLLARDGKVKSRFLCGHDEREWFVAAIPEATPVTTVADAKEALKPEGVAPAATLPRRQRGRRRTSAYIRQGEWFFIPVPGFDPGDAQIYRNEIITRAGRAGKPHVCEELVRLNGVTVYLRGTTMITMDEFDALRPRERRGYRYQTRDATVFVRGAIRHPDHATVMLKGWHEVRLNTEQQARAMSHVAFVD